MTTSQLAVVVMQRAIEDATARGLTKPFDLALAVRRALDDEGLNIVRKPPPRSPNRKD